MHICYVVLFWCSVWFYQMLSCIKKAETNRKNFLQSIIFFVFIFVNNSLTTNYFPWISFYMIYFFCRDVPSSNTTSTLRVKRSKIKLDSNLSSSSQLWVEFNFTTFHSKTRNCARDWYMLTTRGVHRAGQNLPCPVQDRIQDRFLEIYVALDRAESKLGQDRSEQVGVHMPWRFCGAKVCVLR